MALALSSARMLVQRTGTLAPRLMDVVFRKPTALSVGGALGVGLGLLGEAILRAVPKQRTSHSKKRMRMSNKGLKNRNDIVPCTGCGSPKLISQICPTCYKDIKRTLKQSKATDEQ
ncbi:hypothetical protein IW140_002162 [Coemansia sp. RSA 1813]|nr:hypothetical protein EV178_001311 [Coemansia sp. RSA 1646]KAJ1770240.1 hypothetical protein LPJ74_003385 [Coemansia sp. RSA 1843]KAJ2090197.1 hypothetical protein IW138_002829 [Coemansia sp. RSA 986]KAJ2214603.1 hypothetical protein EV179_002862 [Coemansia sp. RSA 487]KAJ2570736.1 hypothetical protein IW140_002162 [Coemansia sp. RSA 1813]